MSHVGGLGDSALPRQVEALLIGQLLHVQGHRTCIVAELVVFWDVHVAFCVTCVVGHPDCDWGTCNGHLKATVDGGGRQRERRDTHTWVSSQEPMLSWLSQGLPQRTIGTGMHTGAGREGPSDHVSPVDRVLLREGG